MNTLKSLLTITLLSLTQMSMAQTIVIQDFEVWNGNQPSPSSWSAQRSLAPTNDAHGGTKACRFNVTMGVVELKSGLLSGSARFNNQPVQTLTIWYKAYFTSNNAKLKSFLYSVDTISTCYGGGYIDIATSSSSVYKAANFPLSYTTGTCQPNKIQLTDIAITDPGSTSDYAIIDDITISSNPPLSEKEIVAKGTAIELVYPNPSKSDRTEIIYTIAEGSNVELNIMDLSGRIVSSLVKENQTPGQYKAILAQGELSPGVYLCQLKTETGSEIKKLVIN